MRSLIRFTKMHGTGNDFIVIDAVTQHLHMTHRLIKRLADRHVGVGCDQLLLLEPPKSRDVDFSYRIFNPDGQEVAQCGNGARCIARFAYDTGLIAKKNIAMETLAGRLEMEIKKSGLVRVNMGPPNFSPEAIPINAAPKEGILYSLPIPEAPTAAVLSLGNPHCVITVPETQEAPLLDWAKLLAKESLFPEGVNLSAMTILADNHIRLSILERGAGLTRACGSAACAAVIAGIKQGLLTEEVRVDMPGGYVTVCWPEKAGSIYLTGPSASLFRGHFILNHG